MARDDQVNVMIARFPYGNIQHPDVEDWLVSTVLAIKADERIGNVFNIKINDTPITMTRNLAVETAKEAGADYLVMVDNDMAPDCEKGAPPFWAVAFDYLYRLDKPALIAAPYMGPPPKSMPYVFTFKSNMNPDDQQNPQIQLEMYDRETAAIKQGIEEVAALPTGLILIDMRVFAVLKPPYFYYEYTDKYQTRKASTEDVAFTRDCTLAGMPCFVTWDCWAGHHKGLKMTKPKLFTTDMIRQEFQSVLLRGISSRDRIREMPPMPPDELADLQAAMRGASRAITGTTCCMSDKETLHAVR